MEERRCSMTIVIREIGLIRRTYLAEEDRYGIFAECLFHMKIIREVPSVTTLDQNSISMRSRTVRDSLPSPGRHCFEIPVRIEAWVWRGNIRVCESYFAVE
jgi:hypothetical protein